MVLHNTKTVQGMDDKTCVDIETLEDGTIEICTDEPRTCCVAVVRLDEEKTKELISLLQSTLTPQK